MNKLSGGSKPPDNYKLPEIGDFGTERVGQTNTAYLLVELLDEKNNVINPQYARIDVNLSVAGWQPLNLAEKIEKFQNECTQSGILRFSLVNDTDYNIWFDDFEITHKQGDEKINVTSWTDYYPYGKVAKTSCPANGAYRYGYQGEFAEKEEEWNSFELRQYDSEIGRWLSTDPMRQHYSPYVGMSNDPVNLTDPTGGCTDCPDNDPPEGWGEGYMIDEVTISPSFFNRVGMFIDQMAMDIRRSDQAFERSMQKNIGGGGVNLNVSGSMFGWGVSFSGGVVGDAKGGHVFYGYSFNQTPLNWIPQVGIDGGITIYKNENGQQFDAQSQLAGRGNASGLGIGTLALGISSDDVKDSGTNALGIDKGRSFTALYIGVGGGLAAIDLGTSNTPSASSATVLNDTKVSSWIRDGSNGGFGYFTKFK